MASGSVAGFRIQQTVLALTSEVVGRTEDVTGTVTIAGGRITSATVRVNLLALTFNGKPAPQFGKSLETQRYPEATIRLAQPANLDGSFDSGTITGHLTLHGVSRTMTVPLSARRDGANVEVVGSIPVPFRDWGIAQPAGYGIRGSLADHGVAEFLLVLQRS